MSEPPHDPVAPTEAPLLRPVRRGSWFLALVLIQVALVAVLAGWLFDGRTIGAPTVWAWAPRPKPVLLGPLLQASLVGAVILSVGWLGLQRIRSRRRSDAPIVAALIVLAPALQLAIAGLAPRATFTLIASTASPVSTEYFGVAWNVDRPTAFVRNYVDEMRRGHHVGTHPPGAVLAYWLCIRAYQSPVFPGEAFARLTEAAVGFPRDAIAAAASEPPGASLTPEAAGPALFCCLVFGVCGALCLAPLYALTRGLAGRRTALIACTLLAVTPAPVLSFQGLDSLVMLLAVVVLALVVTSLKHQRPVLAGVSGLVLGLGFLISFGMGAVGLTAVILIALWARRRPAEERPAVWRALAALVAGAFLVLVLGHLACGMKLHVVFAQAMDAHRRFAGAAAGRPYGLAVVSNLAEIVCFFGLPLAVCLAGALVAVGGRGSRKASGPELVGLSGLLVLVVLDLSGSVRGEVARVWLFALPPLVVWVAHWLSTAAPGKRPLVWVTAGLTLLELLVLGLALTPVTLPY